MVNTGINGFGRIGRLILRASLSRKNSKVNVVAVNDPFLPLKYMAYLFTYDTTHGKFKGTVTVDEKTNTLVVNGQKIKVYAMRDNGKIPWANQKVEYVVDSTGIFLKKELAGKHIGRSDGAKKVVMSAPSKDDTPMFCYGVNHKKLTKDLKIFSGASCTTNCLAPLLKIIHDKYGIKEGLMTTIHASTATQTVVDMAVRGDKWRSGRSALTNIIPASTGAAKAIGKIIPSLDGKLTGMAFRVPTIDGSVCDVTLQLEKGASQKDIEKMYKDAADGEFSEVFGYEDNLIVSSDIVGDKRSSIFDAKASIYLNDKFIKLVSWYDNEWGYSNRIIDLISYHSTL